MLDQSQLETQFIDSLRHHLSGLYIKASGDFSASSFDLELRKLQGDSIYEKFALARPEYVLIRLMGRMSISIGRRLGELYDKIPRFVASARFNLSPDEVAPKLNKLELDIGLKFSQLSSEDVGHVKRVVRQHLQNLEANNGIGIEIRYNFNPNDSARLRKDENMATYLQQEGLLPIYLIFSSISPRDEAIARLHRSGWNFLIGESAITFAKELFGLDLVQILDKPEVRSELEAQIDKIMGVIFNSIRFQQVMGNYSEE